MKTTYFDKYRKVAAIAVIGIAAPISAQTSYKTDQIYHHNQTKSVKDVCGMGVTSAALTRNASLMTVDMNLDLGNFYLSGNRAAVFAPVLVNGNDTLVFNPVGLYSRTRWYQYLRSGEKPLGGEGEKAIRWSERPGTMAYSQTVPYADWMNGAQLYLHRCDYGCCRTLLGELLEPVMLMDVSTGHHDMVFSPTFIYVRPVAETDKTRELVGRAYIDFPVNRTELYPDYRKNPVELAKIVATIDSVRNDKDVTVRRITIKGWASPESSWENNTRLAKGRTATLKQYVQNLYHFPEGFIATDYYPEDWIGLREFVASSDLEHRKEILDIIDSDLEPDPKEWRLKSTYPEEYKFLLNTVYPGLRHSDYTIEYTIRVFTDVDEIRRIMATAPQKLSLDEMFLLAQSYEPGSAEYNGVFETAVRIYPNDEVANLNAANSAMMRGDLTTAERHLSKAGNMDEAVYGRGVLAAMKGDNAAAVQLFTNVEGKLNEAREALKTIKEIMEHSGK